MGITITETRVQDQSSSAFNIKDIINIVYPVGSIYMSVNDTDPSLLFHGTWERIKDRFLLASGDTYSAGSTGGEATHTLTIDEMPSHNHIVCDDIAGKANVAQINAWRINELPNTKVTYVQKGQSFNGAETEPTGGSQPHNNMPPYLTVYIWKRVA